jgi:cholesterol transport system auxiliary component
MIYHSKLQFALGVMTALASLTGCGGKIRYPSYYVLNVPAPPTVNDRSNPVLGSVAVRQFSAPSFLKEGSIVYRPSDEQLEFYNYHRWAEDPRRVATQAMAREIQARGLFKSVEIFDGRDSPDYLITGTLDHLEEIDQRSKVSIEVSLSARLINLRTGEELWRDTSTKTATLDERSVPGIVSELSRDLGSAVASLTSSMQDRLSTASSLSSSHTEQVQTKDIPRSAETLVH